jgi:hypothetical protein
VVRNLDQATRSPKEKVGIMVRARGYEENVGGEEERRERRINLSISDLETATPVRILDLSWRCPPLMRMRNEDRWQG